MELKSVYAYKYIITCFAYTLFKVPFILNYYKKIIKTKINFNNIGLKKYRKLHIYYKLFIIYTFLNSQLLMFYFKSVYNI